MIRVLAATLLLVGACGDDTAATADAPSSDAAIPRDASSTSHDASGSATDASAPTSDASLAAGDGAMMSDLIAPAPDAAVAPDVTLDDIEDHLPWQTCGNCANSGATGATAYTEFNASTVEQEDGHAVENDVGESVSGASENHPPYGDAYWWKEHGKLPSQLHTVDYWLDLWVPATNHAGQATAPQAIEFEVQQTRSNVVYNLAWQCDYSSNQWRIFQYGGAGNGQWLASGITGADFPSGSVKLATDAWHHLHARYHIDTSTSPATVYHDFLEVDGVAHPSTATVKSWTSSTNRSDQFSNAVQLDMNAVTCTQGSSPSCQQTSSGAWKEGTPYHVFWDRVHLAASY